MADDDLPSGVILLDRPRPKPDEPGRATDREPASGAPSGAAHRPALHPRIRDRRLTVQRDLGRRRLQRLGWALGGVATLVVGAALAQTPLFDVDRLVVTGTDRTDVDTVLWAAGIAPGHALLTIDEAGAERRIEELPWVADADVVRDWPGTVRVVVTEREPAALVQVDPALPPAVVDSTGRVLDVGGPLPPGLVSVIDGPSRLVEGEVVPATARDALRVAVGAAQRVPGAVVAVSRELEATLAGGGVVRFGSAAALEEKLVALATVLSDVDVANLAVLDLRVPGSPALTRNG